MNFRILVEGSMDYIYVHLLVLKYIKELKKNQRLNTVWLYVHFCPTLGRPEPLGGGGGGEGMDAKLFVEGLMDILIMHPNVFSTFGSREDDFPKYGSFVLFAEWLKWPKHSST